MWGHVTLLDCHSSDLITWAMKMNYLQHTKMYTFSVAVRLSWMEKLPICVCVCVCCVLVKSRRWLCGTAVKAALFGGITWNDTQRWHTVRALTHTRHRTHTPDTQVHPQWAAQSFVKECQVQERNSLVQPCPMCSLKTIHKHKPTDISQAFVKVYKLIDQLSQSHSYWTHPLNATFWNTSRCHFAIYVLLN